MLVVAVAGGLCAWLALHDWSSRKPAPTLDAPTRDAVHGARRESAAEDDATGARQSRGMTGRVVVQIAAEDGNLPSNLFVRAYGASFSIRRRVQASQASFSKTELQFPCTLVCERESGVSLTVDALRLIPGCAPKQTLQIRTRMDLQVRVRDARGTALEATVYTNVAKHAHRLKFATKETIPETQDYFALSVERQSNDPRLVVFADGFAPKEVVLSEHMGFPWQLRPLDVVLEPGASIKIRVSDRHGRAREGTTVLLRSVCAQRIGGELIYLSMGRNHARISLGVWEEAITNANGIAEFPGVDLTKLDGLKVKVLEGAKQLDPPSSTVLKPPFYAPLVIPIVVE